jgi:hypothetical protein
MAAIRTNADAIAWLKGEGLYEGLELHEHDGETCVIERKACGRCGGSGRYPSSAYDGICLRCHGGGRRRIKHTGLKKYAQAAKRSATAREKRAAEWRAEQAEREEKMLEGQRRWCEENGYGRITFEERDAIREAERKAAIAKKVWVGTIGEREEFTVTVVAMPSWNTHYGYSTQTVYCYIMEDPAGNKLIWKSASYTELDRGVTARIKGTVKEHGEREGEKQTILTRVAVLEVLNPEAETEKEAA